MASHNSKYYTRKIRKKDGKDSKTIDSMFKKQISTSGVQTVESKQIKESEILSTSCSSAPTPNVTQRDKVITESSVSDNRSSSTKYDDDFDQCEPPSKIQDKRTFDSSKYEREYNWLYYNVNKEGYMCKFCELFPFMSEKGGSKWGEAGVLLGTHPSRKLDKHQDSDHHQQASARYCNAHGSFVVQHSRKKMSSVYQQLQSYAEKKEKDDRLRNREVLKKMFQVVYYICRKYWSQTSYQDLIKFMADLGVPEFQDHIQNAPKYATYMSDATAGELINIIGNYLEEKMLRSVRNADFFTLLADESTDEQNREQMTIFIKWPGAGDSQNHFMGIIHVERTDAESLMEAIQQFCVRKALDLGKCRFVGFDGANVMSGEVSGLQRRVRHFSPKCLYMNCRNHRLALCLKHLMKEYQLLVDVDQALLAIWKLFHYSPQRFSVFQRVQETYGDKKITLIRAAATRWLSHGNACARFIDRYEACIDALDEIYNNKREPEVMGVRIAVTNKNTVMMTLLLCDVLKPVNILSEFLQKADVDFMDVDVKVKAAINELEEINNKVQSRNQHPGLYFSKCDELMAEITDRANLRRRVRGENFLQPDDFVREHAIPFINSLIGEITDAFECHPVFKAFKALDPRDLPENLQELADHGNAAIETLIKQYAVPKEDTFRGHITRSPPDVDSADLLRTEFSGFKHQLYMFSDCQFS